MGFFDAIKRFFTENKTESSNDRCELSGVLAPWEEREIEEKIDRLRLEGRSNEADELQKKYDEQQAWDYDNEDDF